MRCTQAADHPNFSWQLNSGGWVIASVLPLTERNEMTEKKARNSIWWILGLTGTAIIVFLAFSYQDWNARNRPEFISGRWYMDDLRTGEIENRLVKIGRAHV